MPWPSRDRSIPPIAQTDQDRALQPRADGGEYSRVGIAPDNDDQHQPPLETGRHGVVWIPGSQRLQDEDDEECARAEQSRDQDEAGQPATEQNGRARNGSRDEVADRSILHLLRHDGRAEDDGDERHDRLHDEQVADGGRGHIGVRRCELRDEERHEDRDGDEAQAQKRTARKERALEVGQEDVIAVSWSKLDDLWIASDLSLPFSLEGFTTRWVQNTFEKLNDVIGATIQSVKLGRGEMSIRGHDIEIWTRLLIQTDGGWLEIFNALDENGYDFHLNAPADTFTDCV